MSKDNKVLEIANFLNKNPKATGRTVSKKFKVALSYAYVLMSRAKAIKSEADEVVKEAEGGIAIPTIVGNKVMIGRGEWRPKIRMQASQVAEISHPDHTGDLVNHPPHYKVGGIETIDFIEAKSLDYHLGNVVKYITRADHKGSKLDDLKKAQWYLNRAIENESAKS